MKTTNMCLILVLVGIIIWSLCFVPPIKEGFDATRSQSQGISTQKVFVINLDKDTSRYNDFLEYYNQSDFADIPCERFSAINGKNVNSEDYLSEHAKSEFQEVKSQGYRTKHHQLTDGGVGCFLSHTSLAKKLVDEEEDDVQYIVFEDDIACKPNSKQQFDKYMKQAPEDWDYLSFQQWKLEGDDVNEHFKRPSSFWGTGFYVMNKSGAQKLLDEMNSVKMDGQIDAYLSRMSQQRKMNLYACPKSLTKDNSKNESNIQIQIKKKPGVDPKDYFGVML